MDISLSLVIDVIVVTIALACILAVSSRSIFNPSLWWLALHIYTVTFRLITLCLGSESMWEIGIQSNTEYVKAAAAADLSLIAVALATIWVSKCHHNSKAPLEHIQSKSHLSVRAGWIISILCLTIGGYALIKFGYIASAARDSGIDISAVDLGRVEETAIPITIAGFAVQGALLQCAMCGFTRLRLMILLPLLILTAVNLARTAFVLAVCLALLIYLTRRGWRSIPRSWAIGMVLLAVVWFVQKPIVGGISEGKGLDEIWSSVHDYLAQSAEDKSSIDTQFLDMQATFMASADEIGKRYLGATVVPLLYLPIPRFLWPDKPRINQPEVELSSQVRQIVRVGMVPTLSGESYVNFGWAGCALIPFLYLFAMQKAFRHVEGHSVTSTSRWVYLIFLICMVQVFRDGLNSLVTFGVLTYCPLLAWAAISKALGSQSPRKRGSQYISGPGYGSDH